MRFGIAPPKAAIEVYVGAMPKRIAPYTLLA